jgi:hypothetical protein
MSTRPSTISRGGFISYDKTIVYFYRILQIKSEESRKLSAELDDIVRGEMSKFLNDFKTSLINIYKDLRYMLCY